MESHQPPRNERGVKQLVQVFDRRNVTGFHSTLASMASLSPKLNIHPNDAILSGPERGMPQTRFLRQSTYPRASTFHFVNPFLMRTSLTVIACSSILASVQAADSEPIDLSKVDKSGYHLFNPTPREYMREMSTDRPDKKIGRASCRERV